MFLIEFFFLKLPKTRYNQICFREVHIYKTCSREKVKTTETRHYSCTFNIKAQI